MIQLLKSEFHVEKGLAKALCYNLGLTNFLPRKYVNPDNHREFTSSIFIFLSLKSNKHNQSKLTMAGIQERSAANRGVLNRKPESVISTSEKVGEIRREKSLGPSQQQQEEGQEGKIRSTFIVTSP